MTTSTLAWAISTSDFDICCLLRLDALVVGHSQVFSSEPLILRKGCYDRAFQGIHYKGYERFINKLGRVDRVVKVVKMNEHFNEVEWISKGSGAGRFVKQSACVEGERSRKGLFYMTCPPKSSNCVGSGSKNRENACIVPYIIIPPPIQRVVAVLVKICRW